MFAYCGLMTVQWINELVLAFDGFLGEDALSSFPVALHGDFLSSLSLEWETEFLWNIHLWL